MTTTRAPRTPRPVTRSNRQAAHRLSLLESMLRVRRFEERCVELYSAARIRGFTHLYIGEEAVAVGVNEALTDDDAVVSTYREHGARPDQVEVRGRPSAVSPGVPARSAPGPHSRCSTTLRAPVPVPCSNTS